MTSITAGYGDVNRVYVKPHYGKACPIFRLGNRQPYYDCDLSYMLLFPISAIVITSNPEMKPHLVFLFVVFSAR